MQAIRSIESPRGGEATVGGQHLALEHREPFEPRSALGHEQEFDRLFESGSVEARMEIYLRLFYSPTFAALAERAITLPRASALEPGPASVLGCLRLVDFERLKVEQRGRLSQLGRQLRKQAQPLWASLSTEEISRLVATFADAPEFWQPRGRSGTENFCLFAHAAFEREGRFFLADLAQLLGTISGSSAHYDRPSPWPNRRTAPPAPSGKVLASEAFVARCSLLDENGHIRDRVPEPAGASGDAEPGFMTFVWTFEDRSSLVGTTALDAGGDATCGQD